MKLRNGSLLLVALAALGSCGDEPSDSAGSSGGGAPPCPPSVETCNGADDDCDGVPDDGQCSAPALDRAWSLGGSGADVVRGIAVDDDGNVYVTGGVTSPAELGVPVEGARGFVASLDAQGALRWSYLWGDPNGSGYSYGQDLSLASGKVCVGGVYSGPFDFGGGVRSSTGYNDAVVFCLNAGDGSYLWDRAFGDELSDVVEGVRVTPSGDVVVAGDIEKGGADFGGGFVPDAGFFVARYTSDGALGWARTYPSAGANFSQTPAVDSAGRVYVTGRFYGTLDFGGGVRGKDGSSNGFVLALDADGGYRWDVITASAADFYGAAVQSDDAVVVAGDFSQSLDLGGASVPSHSADSRDLFAASFDASGKLLWTYTAGGAASTRGFSLAIGASDEVLLTGSFIGTTTFGDVAQTSAGADDMHVVGLTPDGKYLWDLALGSPAIDELNAVAINAGGAIVVGGESEGDLNLGDAGSHVNAGGFDGVVLYIR